MTAYITVADCEDASSAFGCQARFTAIPEFSDVGTGAVLFGVGALAFFVARKRRAATIDLAKEEQLLDQAGGNFEMMTDRGVRV